MQAGQNRMALVPSLSFAVIAARAFGISCVDGVFNDLKDEQGFAAECEQGLLLGMDGKTLIHPSQIESANRIFSPSPDEVAWAKGVIEVFALPENAAKGVVTLNGKMVERLHLTMAQRIMAKVETDSHEQVHLRQLLRRFRCRPAHCPRHATHGDHGRCGALYRPLWFTLRRAILRRLCSRSVGYSAAPIDDMLVFHIVFGKTVPDISLNAVANLGYAECRFLKPVYPGDTLYAVTDIIGLKENSNGKTGTVYVRSTGFNHNDEKVLEFVRWVMVKKRDESSPAPAPVLPSLAPAVAASDLGAACPAINTQHWNNDLAGSRHRFDDYAIGEKIDHIDGMTVEEAEHQLATRLYQNTAKVHFNQHTEQQGRFGRRLIYGGHVISLARCPLLQRPRQCLPHQRHQCGPSCGPTVCRRHGLCVVRDQR